MCEPRCKVCWLQSTNKEIGDLQLISKSARNQLEESVNAVLAVKHSVEDVLKRCSLLQKLEKDKPAFLNKATLEEKASDVKHVVTENPKDSILFVAVATGLTSDGTFWGRYWNNETPFIDSRLHQISEHLESLQKDETIEIAEKQESKQVVFCYSKTHSLFLRAIIQKHSSNGLEVRYVDLGTLEIVGDDVTFYILDEDYVKNNSFLSVYCLLHFEDEKASIPRVAKWCFRDLTANHILLARVVKTVEEDNLLCHHVELKTIFGEPKFINEEVSKKISEFEENERIKAEEKSRLKESCNNTNQEKDKEEESVDLSTNTEKDDRTDEIRKRILKEYLLSKKKIRPRLYSVQSDEKSFDFGINETMMQNSRSLSNLFDIDPDAINVEKEVKSKKKRVEWWEKIPDEERRSVPTRLPPLRNLFYTKRIIRRDPWDEIELMNINELLKSESNMIFYAFEFHPNFIEKSFNNNFFFFGKKDFPKAVANIEKNLGVVSQYIFLIQRGNEPDMYRVFGLARIETLKSDAGGTQIYISYYSLCDIEQCKIVCSSKYPCSVDLKPAKEIVQKMKTYIENGFAQPMYENYFPYCGVPPLISFQKPSYPTFSKTQNRTNKNKEEYRERKASREEFRDFKDKKNERRNNNSNNNRKKKDIRRRERKTSADNWRSGYGSDYERDNSEVSNEKHKSGNKKDVMMQFKEALDDHSAEKQKITEEKRNGHHPGDDPAIIGYKMQHEQADF